MDQQISLQRPCTEIIHAAGPICHIAQYEHMIRAGKAARDMLDLSDSSD